MANDGMSHGKTCFDISIFIVLSVSVTMSVTALGLMLGVITACMTLESKAVKKFLIISAFLLISSTSAQAGGFRIVEGKKYPLCVGIKEILEMPENKDFKISNFDAEFYIPEDYVVKKSHKKLIKPKWVPLEEGELEVLVKDDFRLKKGDESILKQLEKFGKNSIEKAEIDIDNEWRVTSGKKETVIRYPHIEKNRKVCLIGAPDYHSYPHLLRFNSSGYNYTCMLFEYASTAYLAHIDAKEDKLLIIEPHSIRLENPVEIPMLSALTFSRVCEIEEIDSSG